VNVHAKMDLTPETSIGPQGRRRGQKGPALIDAGSPLHGCGTPEFRYVTCNETIRYVTCNVTK
jgi:hypothetical protein